MQRLMLTTAIVALGASSAYAEEECFDKGTLTYAPCPKEEVMIEPEPMMEPAPSFTGLYIGIHGGVVGATGEGAFDNGTSAAEEVILDEDEISYAIGAHIGALYQFDNNVVIGAEVDISTTDLEWDASSTDGVDTIEGEVDYFGSARVKVGYAFDRLMPYATVGAGLVSYEFVVEDESGIGVYDDTAAALVFGGGLEYLITDYAAIRFEGLYYALDEDQDVGATDLPPDANDGDFVEIGDLWTARVGLGFSF